ERADQRSESVGQQRATGAWKLAIAKESALFAHADKGSDVVEQVYEEKDEDQFAQAELEGGAEVESEKRSRGVWQREQMVGPMGEADRNAGESDGDNAEQDRAG